MFFQQFKQSRRVFGMRPVINGQPDGFFFRAKTGDDRAKPAAIGPDGRIDNQKFCAQFQGDKNQFVIPIERQQHGRGQPHGQNQEQRQPARR